MIECPKCGETEELRGERDDDDRITISCEKCRASWVRDRYRCLQCGSSNVYDDKRPIYQKSRGVQQSIIGYNTVQVCGGCGYTDATAAASEHRGYRKEDA